jgi:hypothetical protein
LKIGKQRTAAGGTTPRAKRRATPGAERLEGRVVLNASVSIDAGGMLTLEIPEVGSSSVRISESNGEFLFETQPLSYIGFDLAENTAGLATSGDGTESFRVAGISGLTIDLDAFESVHIVSDDVPTTIHIRDPFANVVLGGGYGTNGLKDVSAPIVVEASGFDERVTGIGTRLSLLDSGSSDASDFTITGHSVEATGGFGGVVYSRLDFLEIDGPSASEGVTRFDIRSTSSGYTSISAPSCAHVVFDVDADVAPDERPPIAEWDTNPVPWFDNALYLSGGGETAYNIKKTPTPVWIVPTYIHDVVNLTRDGSTAGIRHDVTIDPRYQSPDSWRARIVIDDSAGTVARDASFSTDAFFHGVSTFAGVAEDGGRIRLGPDFEGDVVYNAPRGLGNVLTVDMHSDKLAVSSLSYDGGASAATDPESRLILNDEARPNDPWNVSNFAIVRETSTPTGAGAGSLAFETPNPLAFPVWKTLDYRGLSPGGIVDLVHATTYIFDYQGDADPGVAITAGEETADGDPTLLLTSRNASPAFAAATIANKADVIIHTNGTGDLSTTVDYAGAAAPAGLESLLVVTGANDQVDVAAAPPGVPVDVAVVPDALPRPSDGPDDPLAPDEQDQAGDEAQALAPTAEEAGASSSPPAEQVVGAGLVLRFKTTMRAGPSPRPRPRPSAEPASPFRNLRAARMARLEALHVRRLERRRAALASPSR